MSIPRQTWPADAARRYRERGYWTGETLPGLLRDRASAAPDQMAVVSADHRWSYGELDRCADDVAAAFLGLGLAPGDRVVVQLPNIAEFLSVVFGLFRARLLPVFALPAHRHRDIAHIARAADAVAYVIPSTFGNVDYREIAAEVVRDVRAIRHVIVCGDAGPFRALAGLDRPAVALATPPPDSVAFLQLSGGSTGLPKLIPRTHDDYLYSVRASADICELDSTSVLMCALPMAHNFPMSSPGFLGVLHAGGAVALTPSPAPDVAFPIIERERVTITGLVPPLALVWAQAAETTTADLSSLRVLQVGGAKLTPELARRLRRTFSATLQQVFGMAEGLVNYTRLDDPEEILINTQGRPISPDDEVRVVDDAGHELAAGVAGHLQTRGPYTIRAYHNADDANAVAFTADGFYRTGDVVVRRSDGYLVVQGRSSDMINRGGEKVSAEEIEDQLLAHPDVYDAVVIAVPDEVLGEKTCAVVIARGAAPRPAALKAWIRSRGLAAYKVPDQVVFVDAFPATGVGKTSRKELRALVRTAWRAAEPVATSES